MKKSIRNLIIMVAVLVVLGGGAAALLLTQPASGDGDSSSSTVSIQSDPVIDREESEIASVLVENPQTALPCCLWAATPPPLRKRTRTLPKAKRMWSSPLTGIRAFT